MCLSYHIGTQSEKLLTEKERLNLVLLRADLTYISPYTYTELNTTRTHCGLNAPMRKTRKNTSFYTNLVLQIHMHTRNVYVLDHLWKHPEEIMGFMREFFNISSPIQHNRRVGVMWASTTKCWAVEILNN